MDGFYGQQFGDVSQDYMSQAPQPSAHDDSMSGMDEGSAYQTNQQQDQQTRHMLSRHNSVSNASTNPQGMSSDDRRQSMPEFSGMNQGGQLNNFQFQPSGTSSQSALLPAGTMYQNQQHAQPMQVVTQYIGGGGQPYSMVSPVQTVQQTSQMHMNMQGDMQMVLDMQNMQDEQTMNNMMKQMSRGQGQMGMMTNSGQFIPSVMVSNQLPHNMRMAMQNNAQDQKGGGGSSSSNNTAIQSSPTRQNMDRSGALSINSNTTQMQTPSSLSKVQTIHTPVESNTPTHSQHPLQPIANQFNSMNFGSNQPDADSNIAQSQQQHHQQQQQQQRQRQLDAANQQWALSHRQMQSFDLADTKQDFANAYSSTGFDMLSVLVRVATRPNPEINIGAVDLSCAFVVCDAHQHDFPIIYVSENFERLTGYTKHEILGRNCRFLQSPDGKVQSGVKRQYVDDESVGYLKTKIEQRKEAQVSLINYRKGGQPFMNLLTMIPVDFDGNETRYFVGFQVDLVEQPNSVTNKNKDGTYTVNYQRGLTMPKYTFNRPSEGVAMTPGQTVSRDDVSTVLTTISSGDSELTSRIWDKILLENTDDVVFVLSLKGLFLYLSPSSKAVLEYDSSELMGTALSSVCHPSDIVPVTRELKDTTSNTAVSVVFRVRRKESGYMWFEGHGSLHTEQGKGRKSIVLVGRERPVYSVSTSDISTSGGIGDNEVWTKLSTSGMFLFVSSNIRAMLDRTPTELVGTSIQTLMRSDSRSDFQRVLELARSGRRASAKHDLFNKRGQVLQAVSTVYPGDAAAGSKPTFFVAQTRLVKYTRPGATGRNAALSKLERQSGSMTGRATSSVGSQGRATSLASGRSSAGKTLPSPSQFMGTFEVAETHGGADGLPLGHQDDQLASEFNLFDELKTTRSTSWQFELRQMEKRNRLLAEELQGLLAARKKRKRRKGAGMVEKDCANCHTKQTPEWRRGPSGNRDLCNSCGLRWAKQQGRISPRTSSHRSAHSDGKQSGGSPAAAAAAPGGGDADAAARRKSIEETLADAKQQQKQQQEQPGPTDGSAQSSHTSKSQRLANAVNASPDTPLQPFGSVQGGVSIPTKIEETDESDAVG